MTEHEATGHKKREEQADKKNRLSQQEPQPLTDQSDTWEEGIFSGTKVPFLPRMDEHAELLGMARSDEKRASIMLQLQQTYGNRYAQHLIESIGVQAKLTISSPNDVYEQEADRVADTVTKAVTPRIQRQEQEEEPEEEGEEEELQAKSILQRQDIPEDELQTKALLQRAAIDALPQVNTEMEGKIDAARGSGEILDDTIREPMEQAFSTDFKGVRVHTDTNADTLNQSLQARAFTTGQDVFFRQSEYSPDSPEGQRLIAHELTHVVQQGGSTLTEPVHPDGKDTLVNDSSSQTGIIERDNKSLEERRVEGKAPESGKAKGVSPPIKTESPSKRVNGVGLSETGVPVMTGELPQLQRRKRRAKKTQPVPTGGESRYEHIKPREKKAPPAPTKTRKEPSPEIESKGPPVPTGGPSRYEHIKSREKKAPPVPTKTKEVSSPEVESKGPTVPTKTGEVPSPEVESKGPTVPVRWYKLWWEGEKERRKYSQSYIMTKEELMEKGGEPGWWAKMTLPFGLKKKSPYVQILDRLDKYHQDVNQYHAKMEPAPVLFQQQVDEVREIWDLLQGWNWRKIKDEAKKGVIDELERQVQQEKTDRLEKIRPWVTAKTLTEAREEVTEGEEKKKGKRKGGHVLEKVDPDHRDFQVLQMLHPMWQEEIDNHNTRLEFFEWVTQQEKGRSEMLLKVLHDRNMKPNCTWGIKEKDYGKWKDKFLKEKEKAPDKLIDRTQYLEEKKTEEKGELPEEIPPRENYELTFKGTEVWRGGESITGMKKYIFVMSPGGKFYAFLEKGETQAYFHHSSFLAGGAAGAAGVIRPLPTGIAIDPESGHYAPGLQQVVNAVRGLIGNGVPKDQIKVQPYHEGPDAISAGDFWEGLGALKQPGVMDMISRYFAAEAKISGQEEIQELFKWLEGKKEKGEQAAIDDMEREDRLTQEQKEEEKEKKEKGEEIFTNKKDFQDRIMLSLSVKRIELALKEGDLEGLKKLEFYDLLKWLDGKMEELQEQFLSKKELKKAGKEISKAQGKLDKQLGANWQKNEFLKHMISEGVLDDTWRQAIEQVII